MNLSVESRTRPKPGEQVNGDRVVVRTAEGITLMAVIDGLGHGPGAAEAANLAGDFLSAARPTTGALALLEGLHRALTTSRGAVGAVCLFDGRSVEYGGVGNVELRAHGLSLAQWQVPGILGQRAPRVRSSRSALKPGDRLLLFSDGISERFSLTELRNLSLSAACDAILDRFARPIDDASVLLAEVQP